MPISKDDCKDIRIEEGTPGGSTYWVTINGANEKALCFRKIPNRPFHCANMAGKGTWHVGTGACRFHGGNAGRKPTTGKNAHVAKTRLAADIQKYLDGDKAKLFDLSRELATVKVLFEEFTEVFPSPSDDTYGIELHRIQQLVGTIGNLVDKISRVESRNALTMSQVLYLRVVMADILMKYVPETKRERAILELAQRVGDGIPLLEE